MFGKKKDKNSEFSPDIMAFKKVQYKFLCKRL